jgi:hypothetical protein
MHDAQLLEACQEFRAADQALKKWGRDSNAPDDDGPPLVADWYAAMDKVVNLAPQTQEGAGAKAHVAALVMESLELSPVSREEQMAMTTLHEIAAMEAGAAPTR